MSERLALSIVINAMGRLELADYGFRSWMLQESPYEYEVILNLFNDQKSRYETLASVKANGCELKIRSFPDIKIFNISATNNLGFHYSSGRWVLFVNSDVIYPSDTVKNLIEDLDARSLFYAELSRANLTEEQTATIKPVVSYVAAGDFNSLRKLKIKDYWRGWNGGWLVERGVFEGIGGFDPNILVHEDEDIQDRMLHYLRRTGRQHTLHGMANIEGYHLYHSTSSLFDTSDIAKARLEVRHKLLAASPAGTDDVVAGHLNSETKILEDIRNTPKPQPMQRYRQKTTKKVLRRVHNAWNVLIGRRVHG